MGSWRKNLKSMRQRMEAALDNNISDISHDVIFIVGEEKLKISCHKLFLSLASPVFETMFSRRHRDQHTACGLKNIHPSFEFLNNASKETCEISNELAMFSRRNKKQSFEFVHSNQTSELANFNQNNETCDISNCNELEISLPDVDPNGLKNLIKYAYTDILKVHVKDALATMYAAQKYDIPELVEHCSLVLHSNKISSENVVTCYQAALHLNDKELEEKSWKFIEMNAGGLLKSEQFFDFSEENLRRFFKLDYMPCLKSELDVFKAMWKWGNRQCEKEGKTVTRENVREVLKNVIPLIRYPVMTHCEFNDIVEPSGILSERECINLYKYFTESGERRLSISKEMNYSIENRTGTGQRFVFCSTVTKEQLDIVNSGHEDSFKVTGNTGDLKLKAVGVVLPRPPNNSSLNDTTINLALFDYSTIAWIAATTKKVSKYLQICYVEFDTAVSIKSNVQYLLRVNSNDQGRRITNPVRFVVYSKDLMSLSTVTWNAPDKQKLALTFIPVQYVIWALQFEF